MNERNKKPKRAAKGKPNTSAAASYGKKKFKGDNKGRHKGRPERQVKKLSVRDFEAVPLGQLELSEEILCATGKMGFKTPTPIQEQIIPLILKKKDVIGLAQTGTGKTAAFLIPIMHMYGKQTELISKRPNVLILTPTRELALQIEEHCKELSLFLPFKCTSVIGGAGIFPQISALARSVNLVVATPGRLIDLMDRGAVFMDKVHTLVIDEADRMFDMGFMQEVSKIVDKIPRRRQTLLFSATMPSAVKKLCHDSLNDPERVEIQPGKVAEGVEQALFYVNGKKKRRLLLHLMEKEDIYSALIFMRTKRGVDRLHRALEDEGLSVGKVHGDLSQGQRQRSLRLFKLGKTQILVATDVASRGLDINNISHVINYEVPNIAEDYVHRVGRTARAENKGHAYTFASDREIDYVRDIERSLKIKLPVRFEDGICDRHDEGKARPRTPDRKQRAKRRFGPNQGAQGGGNATGKKPFKKKKKYSGKTFPGDKQAASSKRKSNAPEKNKRQYKGGN